MDLLFKNFPYFISVYFSVSLKTAAFVFVVIFVLLYAVMRKRTTLTSTVFCSLYFTILIIVTLLNENRTGLSGIILNPFHGVYEIITKGNVHFLRGMISNILLFIPFGIILEIYFKINSSFFKTAILLGSSFLIELLQFIFCIGYFETGDIICNFFGGIIGIIFVYLLKKNKLKFWRL